MTHPARSTKTARARIDAFRPRRGAGLALCALAPLFSSCSDADTARGADGPPLVLMVVVDTLRADHLGCYGYERNTSPAIDAFARESVVFDRAYAPSSWTKPSVPSLLTGRMPSSHGVFEGNSKDEAGRITSDVLSETCVTLAESMKAAGYATGGFVKNAHLKPFLGFDQGFDHYREGIGDAAKIHDAFLDWFDQVRAEDPNKPVFAWIHVLDVHWPYLPAPEALRELPLPETSMELSEEAQKVLRDRVNRGDIVLSEADRAVLRGLYDACIRTYDMRFRELLRELDRRGAYAQSMIVFTSDHGEEFGERGKLGHGHSLHDDLLRIPLIVRLPGNHLAGNRVERLCGLTDVFPTIARRAGAPVPREVVGVDLLADELASWKRDDAVLAELMHGLQYSRAVRTPSWKLEERYRYLGRPRSEESGEGPFARGMRVEVKGEFKGAEFEAERVAYEASADDDLEIRGPVAEIDAARGTIRIGPWTVVAEPDRQVEVRGAEPIPLSRVRVGDVLDVDCDEFDGFELVADDLEVRPDKRSSSSFKIEGIIADTDGPDEFTLGPVEVEVEKGAELRGFDGPIAVVEERRIPLSLLRPESLQDPSRFSREDLLYELKAGVQGDAPDVADSHPDIVKKLARRLEVLRYDGPDDVESAVLDEQTRRELEQAGYLGG